MRGQQPPRDARTDGAAAEQTDAVRARRRQRRRRGRDASDEQRTRGRVCTGTSMVGIRSIGVRMKKAPAVRRGPRLVSVSSALCRRRSGPALAEGSRRRDRRRHHDAEREHARTLPRRRRRARVHQPLPFIPNGEHEPQARPPYPRCSGATRGIQRPPVMSVRSRAAQAVARSVSGSARNASWPWSLARWRYAASQPASAQRRRTLRTNSGG